MVIRAALLAVLTFYPVVTAAGERGLLWRVVQTCLADRALTGGPFPCLEIKLPGNDPARGYAILRAPLENSHVILTPTVRTIGIEDPNLRTDTTPDYFHDAWLARRFVVDAVDQPPARDDLGLAINSRVGRSQDQLHIHVDCLRPDVKASLARQASAIKANVWTRISVLPQAPRYWAMALTSVDLAGINVFSMVADGLKIDPANMDDMTIVVAGAEVRGQPGFVLMARQRVAQYRDIAHGEALLDHACRVLR